MYDYGHRFYDPQIARFTTQDRFAEKYINSSPYQYVCNNPVLNIDINGDSLWITSGALWWSKTLRYENGSLYNKNGSNYTGKTKGFLKKTVNALNQIREGGDAGAKLIGDLQDSKQNVTIENTGSNSETNAYGAKDKNWTDAANGKGTDGTVSWDPSSSQSAPDTRGNTTRPSFVGLAHELAHALDAADGALDNGMWFRFVDVNGVPHVILNAEIWSTHVENMIRGENGVPMRSMYQPGVQSSVILIPGTQKSLYFNGINYNGNSIAPIPVQNVH